MLVESGRGAGHLVTGDDHLALEQDRLSVAFAIEGRTRGRTTTALGLQGLRQVAMRKAVFQSRRGTQQVLDLPRILHARELDHDTAVALLLDDRFRHAECIHAVAQGGDVLLQGEPA